MEPPIESIEQFIEKIKDIKDFLGKKNKKKGEDYEIVYRAFSNKNKNKDVKKEKPSLFDNPRLINDENEIYHDFIAAKPNEFENMTTFDTLTKMRHYEVPNRLLDVTFDPLLALFFSVGREKKDISSEGIKEILKDTTRKDDEKIQNISKLLEKKFDGSNTICVYVVKKENIKNYDSDTVKVLSVLTKLKDDDRKTLKKIVDIFKDYKIDKTKHSFDEFEKKLIKEEIYKKFNDKFKIDLNDKILTYIHKINEYNFVKKKEFTLEGIYKEARRRNYETTTFIYFIASVFEKIDLPLKIAISKKDKEKQLKIKEYMQVNRVKIVFEKYKEQKDVDFIIQKYLELLDKKEKNKKNSNNYYNNVCLLLNYVEYDNKLRDYLEEIKNSIKITKTSKYFTIEKLFNFFVSNCVPELNWQLKQDTPSWYEDSLKIRTFTECYLVKPKMNNPRIIAQSGAFFIYPFEDTDIKKSLLETDDKTIVFEITKEIKEKLNLLNIKETKYMPDDLTKYAKEIKEDDKDKDE